MSEYADLKISDFEIWSFRNYLDRDIITLFFNDDDLEIKENVKYDESDLEEVPHTQYMYSSNVKRAKERFDALGVSMYSVKCEFEKKKYCSIDCYSSLWNHDFDTDEFDEKSKRIIDKNITFKKWLNSIRRIVNYEKENGKISTPFYDKNDFNPKTVCQRIIYNSMRRSDECYYGMYDNWDWKYTFRILLECFNDEDLIECDFSLLFYWDEQPREKYLFDGPAEKIIVMVEGVNDKKILEFAAKHLYPHLYDIFYFMDFEYASNRKRQGGADAIANNTKSFIAAHFKQRFIAVFDNDTVGVFKRKQLHEELNGATPNNFRIINYPNLKFFEKYPTISPNGKIVEDNINQRACSIELYLPNRFIETDGVLNPIQWESLVNLKLRNGTLNSYQGVITKKENIEKVFDNYSKNISKGIDSFNVSEWVRTKELLKQLFFCFKE